LRETFLLFLFFSRPYCRFLHLQTVMRTERNTPAAVDADKWFLRGVEIDGVNGACPGALSAADAEVLAHEHAPAFPL
jgi:hypothetical protein